MKLNVLGVLNSDEIEYYHERIAIMIAEAGMSEKKAKEETCKIIVARRTQEFCNVA